VPRPFAPDPQVSTPPYRLVIATPGDVIAPGGMRWGQEPTLKSPARAQESVPTYPYSAVNCVPAEAGSSTSDLAGNALRRNHRQPCFHLPFVDPRTTGGLALHVYKVAQPSVIDRAPPALTVSSHKTRPVAASTHALSRPSPLLSQAESASPHILHVPIAILQLQPRDCRRRCLTAKAAAGSHRL
jgi:hypothetical protein